MSLTMALLVQKFGGTSVGTIERIEAVAEKVIGYKDGGNDMVVVVSAMSGETNRLIELARQIDPQARGRELDVLLTTGDYHCAYLEQKDIAAEKP